MLKGRTSSQDISISKIIFKSFGYDDFVNNIDEIIEYNKILGCDLCGLGAMPQKFWDEGCNPNEFIKNINKACETLKKENMYFGYHNHAFEFKKINGVTIYDRLINETDSDVFNFIVDTYWLQIGGKNPPDVIRELGKRAMALHFKDFVPTSGWSASMKMGEIGNGNLDWDKIIAACEDTGTRWALVEQDTDHFENDPFKSLEISYNFLKSKGFE